MWHVAASIQKTDVTCVRKHGCVLSSLIYCPLGRVISSFLVPIAQCTLQSLTCDYSIGRVESCIWIRMRFHHYWYSMLLKGGMLLGWHCVIGDLGAKSHVQWLKSNGHRASRFECDSCGSSQSVGPTASSLYSTMQSLVYMHEVTCGCKCCCKVYVVYKAPAAGICYCSVLMHGHDTPLPLEISSTYQYVDRLAIKCDMYR